MTTPTENPPPAVVATENPPIVVGSTDEAPIEVDDAVSSRTTTNPGCSYG